MVNFDLLFRQLTEVPIVVNTLVNSSEDEKNKIRDLITTRYSSDMLSILPACQCGATKGEHVIGVKCEQCGSVVRSVVEESIEPIVWFKAPDGVQKLINPMIWLMLKNRFRKSGYNIIQYICDTTYRPIVKQPKIIADITDMGIQRGYNYFVENFETIMEMLFSMKIFKLKRGQHDYLYSLLKDYKECIFSEYLPLPNKSLLIIEKTNVGIYVDPTVVDAIDAIETIVGIDSSLSEHSVRVKENRTAKAIAKLTDFYEIFFKLNLSRKPGIYRKHVFGARTHFSFRAVVSSLTNNHRYDEIHVPWGIGVTAFRPHLINKLLKRGFGHNQAIGLLYGHVGKYHPLLDELLKELIYESPGHKIPVLIQRNQFTQVSFTSNGVDITL